MMIAMADAAAAQRSIRAAVAEGDEPFAYRIICQVLARARAMSEAELLAYLVPLDVSDGRTETECRWDAFLAGILAQEASRAKLPELSFNYLYDERLFLDSWWFYRFRPNRIGYLIANSPPNLRMRGVFVDSHSLESI